MERVGAARLRIGILSTADIAVRKVVPGMRRAERVEVVAIGSRDEARARSVGEALGIERVHGSYEALLRDDAVDAVYIPLPNHLHAEWTIAAAEAGKHVLCEKPLALSAAEAQRMVDACRAAGVVLQEAFMYRLHPSWLAVRSLIDEGRIGRPMSIQTWFSYFNDDPANIRNVADFGGGALMDIGCYAIDLSRMLFDAEPTHVSASMRRDPASGVDILTSAILEFDTGIASFTVSTRTEPDQRVEIYGTEGRISIGIPFNIPPDRPTVVHVVAGGEPPVAPAIETLTFPTADPYGVEADALAAAVLDGAVAVPPDSAVANMAVIEAVVAAAAATARVA